MRSSSKVLFRHTYQLLCCLCFLCWGLFTAIAMSWRTPWSVPQASRSAASRPMLCDQRWNGRSSICTEIHLWNLALASGVFDGVHLDVQTTTWTFRIFRMFREAAPTAGHLKSKLRRAKRQGRYVYAPLQALHRCPGHETWSTWSTWSTWNQDRWPMLTTFVKSLKHGWTFGCFSGGKLRPYKIEAWTSWNCRGDIWHRC